MGQSSNIESATHHQEANIGRLLLDMGKISPKDAEQILRLQKEEGLRFGDAAQKLGLITAEDINQVLSLQFAYPYLLAGQGHFDSKLVAAYQPFTSEVEELRALRSQLLLRWFSDTEKVLAIVSANSGEGCSHLAANLAIVFSQLGENTLLIDANLREPCQNKIFNLTEKQGLSDILAGRAGIEVVTRIDVFNSLNILGAGTTPPNPQELLSRSSFANFISQVSSNYDVVIIDTPPALKNSDAQSVIAKCHGALLVSRLNHTLVSDMSDLCAQIKVTGASIVGAVLNEY